MAEPIGASVASDSSLVLLGIQGIPVEVRGVCFLGGVLTYRDFLLCVLREFVSPVIVIVGGTVQSHRHA